MPSITTGLAVTGSGPLPPPPKTPVPNNIPRISPVNAKHASNAKTAG